MQIEFHPADDSEALVRAADEYRTIWDSDSVEILRAVRRNTGLEFAEDAVTATVHNGMSRSHPLQLRANQPKELKQATLVHELLHRLCVSNNVQLIDDSESFILAGHKVIYLVLYDILSDIYGRKLAETARKTESTRNDEYRQAWDWALSHDKQQRLKMFKTLRSKNI